MKNLVKIHVKKEPMINFLNILNDIYLPLIGRKCLNLFLFYLANDGLLTSLNDIASLNEISNEELYIFNRKLNALKLVQILINEEKTVFLINSPLQPVDFFASFVLKTLFITATSEETQNKIFNKYFIDDEHERYKEIEVQLNDVFNFDVDTNKNLNKRIKNKIKVKDKITVKGTFSIAKCSAYLVKLIPNFKLEKLSEEEVNKIIELANLYGIKEQKVAEIINKSYEENNDYSKKINFETLEKFILMYLKYDKGFISINKKEKKLKFESNSDNAKLIEYYMNTAPLKLLEDNLDGIKPSKQEKTVVDLLHDKYGFSNGIINVILDYLLNIYKFLSIDYAENYARFFIRNGVKDCFSALDLLYGKKQSNTNSKKESNTSNNSNIKNKNNSEKEEIHFLCDENDDTPTDFD